MKKNKNQPKQTGHYFPSAKILCVSASIVRKLFRLFTYVFSRTAACII